MNWKTNEENFRLRHASHTLLSPLLIDIVFHGKFFAPIMWPPFVTMTVFVCTNTIKSDGKARWNFQVYAQCVLYNWKTLQIQRNVNINLDIKYPSTYKCKAAWKLWSENFILISRRWRERKTPRFYLPHVGMFLEKQKELKIIKFLISNLMFSKLQVLRCFGLF